MSDIAFLIDFDNESMYKTIYDWRMEESARKMSLHQQGCTYAKFKENFDRKFFLLKDLPPLLVLFEKRAVAFVSFRPYGHASCEISLVVAHEERKKGIASCILEKVKAFVQKQGYTTLYAQILEENTISKNLFVKAGFQQKETLSLSIEEEDGTSIERNVTVFSYALQKEKKKHVQVIAEIGSNWRLGSIASDLKLLRTYIEQIQEAKADIVKLQVFTPGSLYVENAGKSDYLAESGYTEDIKSMLEKVSVPKELIPEIAKMCSEHGLEFMASVFSEEDFHAVDPFVHRHKNASYEISHLRLLELFAKSKKPLFLSTGASNLEDIAWAVDTFYAHGGKDLTLLQCTAKYPAPEKSMNLHVLETLKNCFHVPVGLSDHSKDPYAAPLAAVALGATVIEKHVTLNRSLPGPDHSFAILLSELKELVKMIRTVEEMLGDGIKTVQPEEKELFYFARRYVQAIAPIKKGELFQEGKNIAILRPGVQKCGVHPKHLEKLLGRKATRDIPIGDGISFGDWHE